MLKGLNHITLAVINLDASLDFYIHELGFKGLVKWEKGAYLSLGDLWLCFTLSTKKIANNSYTHIAFSVDEKDFSEIRKKLITRKVEQWQINSSEGNSYYFLDPDGYKLELHVGGLQERLNSLKERPYNDLQWL